ncbi:M24 family metallopeptidase [Acetomicrobium sp. UBA5826]|uniref:M24 family metallopeptidase n=1 Tax=Acetomicrobium sp. UBA5826 TaxID=1946039 RepID=UPI00257BB151|nr:M24 family metallopeptidase [Acetomicrobium sp. UBA5826]
MALLFEVSEYQDRLRKVKESMLRKGIQVLIVSDPANMNYLTGYDGWSFYVHQGLVIALDYDEPIWWGRGMDANGAKLTTWLKHYNIRPYADDYVQNVFKHPMSFVADILREMGWENRHIGVEKDNYWFTGQCLDVLREELPQAKFHDATSLVNWIRTIKSPAEIKYIKEAAKVCEHVMKTAIDSIEVGRLESEAAANVYHAMIKGTDEFTGDHPAIFPIMPSNERTSAAHLGWKPDRKYAPGDIVLLELCGVRFRYHCPLSRTVYIGDPPKELKEIADVVIDGIAKTLDFIKPGVTAEEIEAKWREAISGSRVVKPSRLGYAFGLNYVPDWGEHTVSLRPGDKTIMKPGMTIHLMPGIWLDEFGFECSEPFLVTEKGCETFLNFPRKIFTK